MKFAITFLLFATSAFAEVELYSRIEKKECIINSKTVTRRMVLEANQLGFTTSKSFSGYGYEELAKKVAALSTNRTSPFDMVMTAKIDGVTYNITREDSKEAAQLISFIANVCN